MDVAFDQRNCSYNSYTSVYSRKHIAELSNAPSCACAMSVPLDQPDTWDSWLISEPLSLTNAVLKPIIYVFIREWHSHARTRAHAHIRTFNLLHWGKRKTLLLIVEPTF